MCLGFLPDAEFVGKVTVQPDTRSFPAIRDYTESPLADPSLDISVESQPLICAAFTTQLAGAR